VGPPVQAKAAPGRTGLPGVLRAGVERLSGVSLDDVRVHYGSREPARVNALAYTQGSHIHVAPGEERHLPHEAWHVVQQKQRRVAATTRVAGRGVNDDDALEREADTMGARAAAAGALAPGVMPASRGAPAAAPLQRVKGADDSDSEDEDEPEPETDTFEQHLDFMGAKQQGKVSTDFGKHYEGPVSMEGKRAEQVTRHFTNLALNRLTHEGTKADDGFKPVELQMSSVGGTLLLNSNNRKASQALYDNITASGGPLSYVRGADAQKPAMDQDKERPKRQLTKLESTVKGERPWQTAPGANETDEDMAKASGIVGALNKNTVGLLDPTDEEAMKAEVEKMKTGKGHSMYVYLHGPDDKKDEHAERVQSRFRAAHLSDMENELSTPPSGPKTTCLGCASWHTANVPEVGLEPQYTGAYFGGASPAVTEEEQDAAMDIVTSQPATGSISQHGYQRNSDYPDSETDTEGEQVYPRPLGFTVGYGEERPKQVKWEMRSGEVRSHRTSVKSLGVVKADAKARAKAKRDAEKAKQAAASKYKALTEARAKTSK
jgi:hypothetical protein